MVLPHNEPSAHVPGPGDGVSHCQGLILLPTAFGEMVDGHFFRVEDCDMRWHGRFLKDGHVASPVLEDELKQFVKDKLAPYKYPRWIDFVPALPKTATGKIQRFKLR